QATTERGSWTGSRKMAPASSRADAPIYPLYEPGQARRRNENGGRSRHFRNDLPASALLGGRGLGSSGLLGSLGGGLLGGQRLRGRDLLGLQPRTLRQQGLALGVVQLLGADARILDDAGRLAAAIAQV